MGDLATNYPHLARFCNQEGVDIVPYTRTHQRLVLQDIVGYSVPPQQMSSNEARKSILNQCLELAYRHNILKVDRKSRLKSKDSIRFWSLINELKVAAWLEAQGLTVAFDPPSLCGGRGDLEVSSKHSTVFVEVKTLFGNREMLDQQDLLSKLAKYLEEGKLPVSLIELVSYPSDFCEAGLDQLFSKIRSYLQRVAPPTGDWSPRVRRYNNRKGLAIDFKLSPGASTVKQMVYGGFIDIEDNLKFKLGILVRGRTPKVQLSSNDIPSIVIICDQGAWSDPIIEGILYGNKVGTLGSKGVVRYKRKRDGRWDNTCLSRLSAVGIWKADLGMTPSSVDIYLCPNPLFPLPKSLLNDSSIKWWQLGDDKISIVRGID